MPYPFRQDRGIPGQDMGTPRQDKVTNRHDGEYPQIWWVIPPSRDMPRALRLLWSRGRTFLLLLCTFYIFVLLDPDYCENSICENDAICQESEPYYVKCNCSEAYAGIYCWCKFNFRRIIQGPIHTKRKLNQKRKRSKNKKTSKFSLRKTAIGKPPAAQLSSPEEGRGEFCLFRFCLTRVLCKYYCCCGCYINYSALSDKGYFLQ